MISILKADARKMPLADESVQCVVTPNVVFCLIGGYEILPRSHPPRVEMMQAFAESVFSHHDPGLDWKKSVTLPFGSTVQFGVAFPEQTGGFCAIAPMFPSSSDANESMEADDSGQQLPLFSHQGTGNSQSQSSFYLSWQARNESGIDVFWLPLARHAEFLNDIPHQVSQQDSRAAISSIYVHCAYAQSNRIGGEIQ
jgi:hypothetical protein